MSLFISFIPKASSVLRWGCFGFLANPEVCQPDALLRAERKQSFPHSPLWLVSPLQVNWNGSLRRRVSNKSCFYNAFYLFYHL